ncbi:hypothetical protein RvY_00175 [Ramazzottius varieornatus]|uniref:Uncharacterized protein n=1 Tax=Ramazzottius varieornatus TaxID=947166 RepID=A0A1D1UJ83_RAMVA|nr:hypothetical protein RvY_00175 [Ramazzottius varieornatus]
MKTADTLIGPVANFCCTAFQYIFAGMANMLRPPLNLSGKGYRNNYGTTVWLVLVLGQQINAVVK